MKGYVYVLSNPCMPDLYKVGRSIHGGKKRAKELDSTGVPAPFVLDFEMLAADCVMAEMQAHEALHQYRVDSGKEFFLVDFEECQRAVITACSNTYDFGHPDFSDFSGLYCASLASRISVEDLSDLFLGIPPEQLRSMRLAFLVARRNRRKNHKREIGLQNVADIKGARK